MNGRNPRYASWSEEIPDRLWVWSLSLPGQASAANAAKACGSQPREERLALRRIASLQKAVSFAFQEPHISAIEHDSPNSET